MPALLDRMYKEYQKGEAPDAIEQLIGVIRGADGFLIVSGECNHGVPPALKNLLDHFLKEWFFRPSAVASYSAGAFGEVRAAMQLRATLGEFGMSSIPSIFRALRVQQEFAEDIIPHDPAYEHRVKRFLDEFEWYAEALKAARAKRVPE